MRPADWKTVRLEWTWPEGARIRAHGGSPPPLHQNTGVFLRDWPEDKVTIRIDRIRCHSDNVTGEMCIKANLPGINGHLHLAREQLLSTTTRRTLRSIEH